MAEAEKSVVQQSMEYAGLSADHIKSVETAAPEEFAAYSNAVERLAEVQKQVKDGSTPLQKALTALKEVDGTDDLNVAITRVYESVEKAPEARAAIDDILRDVVQGNAAEQSEGGLLGQALAVEGGPEKIADALKDSKTSDTIVGAVTAEAEKTAINAADALHGKLPEGVTKLEKDKFKYRALGAGENAPGWVARLFGESKDYRQIKHTGKMAMNNISAVKAGGWLAGAAALAYLSGAFSSKDNEQDGEEYAAAR